jgi:endonuclease YncB( thermonuclease family)
LHTPGSEVSVVVPTPADILRVIDGDTFEARVHVWPGLDVTTKVRLRGIDAPELRARCPAERTKAEAARDALTEILAQGAVGVYGISNDTYGGRVVADAATRSTANVSAELLKRGYARFYAGGHRDGWSTRDPALSVTGEAPLHRGDDARTRMQRGSAKDLLVGAMDHVNRDPVIHTWSYKLNGALDMIRN